jgi:hypothetical protein
MRAAEKEQDSKRLAELFGCNLDLEDVSFLHEIVQIAYRNRIDLSNFVGKINIDQWNCSMHQLVGVCSMEQAVNILHYLENYFQKDSLEILSLKIAIELKTLNEHKTQGFETQSAGLNKYVELLYAYHISLNSTNNFTEERSHYLGADARAVYYLKKSIDCGKKGDIASQVRLLKKALYLKSDLVDIVNMMMKHLEIQIEHEKAEFSAQANAEFQALAVQLKSVISEYILNEEYQKARMILDQLNLILPNDPDIKKFQIQLTQSPGGMTIH